MGSTSYLGKPKSPSYKAKSVSSAGSDKDMSGKLRRSKIRRPTKINEYGLKRIPDYTELAYKEAVSKLRYFLSGNYAPSVRSYGGSASIKNLDESDNDLDKKFSSPYTALAEYRPRPKLTAKYASLYADSLHNTKYSPQHTKVIPTPAATSPGADLSGGTNPDVINFIQKQEEYIEQLERESQYCRDELNNLLGKVKEVITENEHLHEAQKNKLITRMFHSYNGGSETDELDDFGDSTGLDSDNKATAAKTRKGKYRSTKLEGPNIVFESRIAELEAQLAQSKIDLKKIQDENNENKRKLASGLVDSTCLDGFKRQIDNLQRDKSSLEAQISKLKLSLEQKDVDFEGRYKRGADGVEQQLREERNNLETEIRILKDDLAKERSKVRELAGEGARRAVQERSAAEQRYHAHFDELQHDLAAQYDNVAKLQLELERQRREENDLKRELSMKSSSVEELKMDLKNKSASLQADLAQANAEKASLEEELASARLAIERQQRQAKHETNRLNSEIQSLRQRLDRADADLVHSRRENLRLSEQIATLEKELNMKNLTPGSPEKNKKEFSTALESMENKHAKTVAELESMIHSQNSLMEKLTGECRLLTDKLDDANRRHKTERTQLLCRNIELMRKLRNLWSSHKKYCTTSLSPYRSYTPLSGYPNSRSSYDIDRTYFTSTPYTNRLKYRRDDSSCKFDTPRDEMGRLSRNLSDLSIDRIGDSDDDPVKIELYKIMSRILHTCESVVTFVVCREELATMQHQIVLLGRSLQQTHSPAPSNYPAPATHSTTPNQNVRSSQADTGPNDSGDNSSRHTGLSEERPAIRPEHSDDRRTVRKQESRTSLLSQNIEDHTPNTDNYVAAPEQKEEYNQNVDVSQVKSLDNNIQETIDQPMEVEHTNYDNTDQNYTEGNYENYETTPAVGGDYSNQPYDQNYEQPTYAGEQYGQYDENQQYDNSYPQNYDPNAQYEGQYENYAPDSTYQTDQTYDNTQDYVQSEVPQENDQVYTHQNQDITLPSQNSGPNVMAESKQNVSPNEKQPSQS